MPSLENAEHRGRALLPIGSVLLGKYRIDGVLGVGGMAVVYAATHRNAKPFALKVLHPELAQRSDLRERFVREGYVANLVEHPGVVAILDDDVTPDGTALLVMERLEGATVEALTRARGRLSPRIALALASQLLDVLAVAHARGVVHRDLKPANLFLVRDGTLKVLDFGIARLETPESPSATLPGAALGTPAFMAPEQALGHAHAIDARTDLWAVGATLWSALTGRAVRDAEHAQEVIVRAATEPVSSLAEAGPDLPRELIALVDKALAFERDARWESAAAMRQAALAVHERLYGTRELDDLSPLVASALERIENAPTQPESAAPAPEAPSRPSIPRRRFPRVLAALALVLALFGVGYRKESADGVTSPSGTGRPPAATPPSSALEERAPAAPKPEPLDTIPSQPEVPPTPPLTKSPPARSSRLLVRPRASAESAESDAPSSSAGARRHPLDLEIQ